MRSEVMMLMALSVLGGCSGLEGDGAVGDAGEVAEVAEVAELTVRERVELGLVDYTERMEHLTPTTYWSPTMCIAPPPSGARMSEADSGSDHGRKLYHLYVSDGDVYRASSNGESAAPVGLMLVKENHEPVWKDWSTDTSGYWTTYETLPDETRRFVSNGGWVPGEITDLFVMYKAGEESDIETDRGWVYAGATAEGEIYNIGVIESCAECHREAPHDGLFGLPPARTVYVGGAVYNEVVMEAWLKYTEENGGDPRGFVKPMQVTDD